MRETQAPITRRLAFVQLQVLQTDEESQGPFAFQLMSLAKLHLNPQVCLLTTKAPYNHIRTSLLIMSGHKRSSLPCMPSLPLTCLQVIYTSSRSDEAFLEALRKPSIPDASDPPHEVWHRLSGWS